MYFKFCIIGTTASGKSDLAIKIAKEFGAVVLSLDSLSVYKEIDIASAKITKQEQEEVKHFGIDLVYPDEEFSVGEFIKEFKIADKYAKENGIPLIITGGSSFYLKAMLDGLAPKIEDIKTNLSNEEIYSLILEIDKDFAQKFSQNDTYRMQKWYSIYKTTNEIPTKFLKENTTLPAIKNLDIFEISWPKEILNERILKRTKKMIENNLLDEAKFLFEKYPHNTKSLKSIGLKECKQYFDKEIDKNELIELIFIHTRQLAKRQRTFNKNFQNKIIDDYKNLEIQIRNFCHKKLNS